MSRRINWTALLILLSSLFLPTTGVHALNFGETNSALPQSDNGNAGLILAQQATLTQSGSLLSLSFYVINPAGLLRLGLYDNTGTGGNPGNLLAQTAEFVPIAGWNTRGLLTTIILQAGTYWLAYWPSSNSLSFAKNPDSGTIRYFTLAYSGAPFPVLFSSTPSLSTTTWAFYGTVSDGAPPAPASGVQVQFTALSVVNPVGLQWDDPSPIIGEFELWRNGVFVSVSADVEGVGVRSTTDVAPVASVHCWQVRATAAGYEPSLFSNEACAYVQ